MAAASTIRAAVHRGSRTAAAMIQYSDCSGSVDHVRISGLNSNESKKLIIAARLSASSLGPKDRNIQPRAPMLATLILRIALLILSTAVGAPVRAESNNITVTPTVVPTEASTRLWVIGTGFSKSNNQAICSITSLDNTFVGYRYRAIGDYNCLRRITAYVVNSTHMSCTTVRLHNSAPAILRASLNNGTTWLPGEPRVDVEPLVEVAVGRRPYTTEREGQLVVKIASAPLLGPSDEVKIVAKLPKSIYAPTLISSSAGSGRISLLTFSLEPLPATVLADLLIIATIPGHGTIEYTRNFQRAPPPRNKNVTLSVVDHTTRGMLLGRGSIESESPWLPFLAVGWFNSAFTYAMEGSGDPTFAPDAKEVSPLLVGGADRATEWGRRGINLVRMGWRNPPELMVAELDHMYANGVYAMIAVPTPGHCNETAKPGKPPRNCSADYENMVGNMTVVKETKLLHKINCGHKHICTGDDCCAGWEYLQELATVYQMMKRIDPYHLTAGALECGEMHAFQEPFLSLDVPMRENYRPDLSFHANDGRVRGGSDGILRMPPMTFEPIINMADAVRQPRPFLAQTAAWLGVITANMPMQNWYVYNRIMYMRWQLDDATAVLNAQILELAPSLLSSVTTVHPTVTILEGSDWIRARAWRDPSFEAQRPQHLCVHLIVASVGERPGNVAIRLEGVCTVGDRNADRKESHLHLPICPTNGLNATHVFNQYYSVPAIFEHDTNSHLINDVITPGTTSIYALGCDGWRLGKSGTQNLVNDGGFEDTELPLLPGFISCVEEAEYPLHTFKGKCKIEDKHAGSWGLTQEGVGAYDGRATFFVDSMMPHSGRHSGRVWLPSAEPVAFGIPGHTTNMDGIKILNGTEYAVELWARSFPSGMTVEVTVGSWVEDRLIPSTPLGVTTRSRYTPLQPRLGAHILGANWTRLTATISSITRPVGATLNLHLAAAQEDVFAAGSIWVDDVSVECVAGCSLDSS